VAAGSVHVVGGGVTSVDVGGGVVATIVVVGKGVAVVAMGVGVDSVTSGVTTVGVLNGVALGSSTTNGGKTSPPSALGVRYVFCQENGVNICALKNGCIKLCCPPAVSTSNLDPIPTSNTHRGMIRMANWPAININKIPSGTIKTSRPQSLRSRSDILMAFSPLVSRRAM
jgi:hypothetical protein